MAYVNTTSAFSGHTNQGFQVANNSGLINNTYNVSQPARLQSRPNPSSTVPFRRDPDFIDCDILDKIREKCSEPASRAALVGLGGVGKSQLAIEYSYRVREEFVDTWVFWVHASSRARFEESYRKIADVVKLSGRDEPKADIFRLVSNWLSDETNGHWVMILDNAYDMSIFFNPSEAEPTTKNLGSVQVVESLSDHLPEAQNRSILVTSRSRDVAFRLTGRSQDIIEVNPMDEDHAQALLRKKLEGKYHRDDMVELLQALDYMPLAMTQAAAYINRSAPRITVTKYLNSFRSSDRNRASLLEKDVGDSRRDRRASNSIITTWQMSFKYIYKQRPSAARLLSLMSLFDRQGIPGFLLHNCKDGEIDIDFEDDVSTLKSYSLIGINIDCDTFEMHRLVQFSTRKWLALKGDLEKWKEEYITIMNKSFPTAQYENWTRCQELFPHAEAVLAYRPAKRDYIIQWAAILSKAAEYAAEKASYSAAEKMNQQALEGREEMLGKKHPDTLTSVSNLATVLRYQGKYDAAETMNQRALEGMEKVLGMEHPDTLTSVSNLAIVLRIQGKYDAAERMDQQALKGREKVLGKEHPDTLTSVSNLALALQDQGKYDAAEIINKRALEGREKVLGKEHPDTLISVGNLALVLQSQGKYEAAEKMNQRALKEREKVLGKEHPHTLISVSNLAIVLQYQGKYDAAEKMHQRALEGWEKVLGKEHPHTLISVSNLAIVLQYQGKYDAAEKMHQRALEGFEKVLGKEHPDTMTSVYEYAYCLHRQKQYHDASLLYQRACAGFEKVLGLHHPDTVVCSKHYSSLLDEMKKSRKPSGRQNRIRRIKSTITRTSEQKVGRLLPSRSRSPIRETDAAPRQRARRSQNMPSRRVSSRVQKVASTTRGQ